MKTRKPAREAVSRLLVLIPHRDARLSLRKYSGDLFKAGFQGAWHFPNVAPLAVLHRALAPRELKACADALRDLSLRESGGKISAHGPLRSGSPFGAGFAVLGAALDAALAQGILPPDADSKTPVLIPQPLLAFGLLPLLPKKENAPLDVFGSAVFENELFPPPPQISFAAASLANMSLRLSGEPFFSRWKIGPPLWLAPVRKSV